MILYKNGNLFDAPKGSILAHACNCRGVWGSGIAVEFKKRFPKSFIKYKEACDKFGSSMRGNALIFDEDGYYIACLFTSDGYGDEVDPPEIIIQHTDAAIADVLAFGSIFEPGEHPIHMPKINSGRFKVPWESTEAVLNEMTESFSTNVTVWELGE